LHYLQVIWACVIVFVVAHASVSALPDVPALTSLGSPEVQESQIQVTRQNYLRTHDLLNGRHLNVKGRLK
jgi:hypothetical protein